MSRYTPDPSDLLCSDDSNAFDFFSSSPTSYRFTSPPVPESRNLVNDLTLMASKRRTLPLELIEYIIKLFHQQHRSFRALRPFSEASSRFRMIAMRRYMTSLSIDSAKQLTSLSKVHISMLSRSNPAWGCIGFHWVKSLRAESRDLAGAPWKPKLLGNLRDLHISFAAEGWSTQKIRSMQIFVDPLMNSPMTHLTSLTLTELWCIDVLLLSAVSEAFPALVSIHLSCSEHLDLSCCWTCFEDSSSLVVHSPIPNHFPTVASLTSAFAKAMKPLTKLTDLHLGIFLSDEEMLENHIDHYDSPKAYSRALRISFGQNRDLVRTGTVLSQPQSPSPQHLDHVSYTEDKEDPYNLETAANITSDELPPFPHGPELCPICSIMVSAPDVRTRELEASLALAHQLKSLRTVGWSSFFDWKVASDHEKRIGDWKRATKTYVLRSGGRVRVRRRPWD